MADLRQGPKRVQEALRAKGYENVVVELPDSARTAAEAARALRCEVAQIAKSLVFRRAESGRAVLVVASGRNRVDEGLVGGILGEALGKADADFVRRETGFAIGGVAPIGHAQALHTIIDRDLLDYDVLWAAAGHPRAVFRLTPDELVRMTEGQVADVKQR